MKNKEKSSCDIFVNLVGPDRGESPWELKMLQFRKKLKLWELWD